LTAAAAPNTNTNTTNTNTTTTTTTTTTNTSSGGGGGDGGGNYTTAAEYDVSEQSQVHALLACADILLELIEATAPSAATAAAGNSDSKRSSTAHLAAIEAALQVDAEAAERASTSASSSSLSAAATTATIATTTTTQPTAATHAAAAVDNYNDEMPYTLAEGISVPAFRRVLLGAASSLLEYVAGLCRLSLQVAVLFTTPQEASSSSSSSSVLGRLALVLMKCGRCCNAEVSVQAALAISALGQRDSLLRNNTATGTGTTAGEGATVTTAGLLTPQVNALLTNALLRRLDEPAAYHSFSVLKSGLDPSSNSSSSSTHQQQQAGSKARTEDKYQRLVVGSLHLMDAALNAIMDLHTSDEPQYLQNYWKLQCSPKLQRSGESFAQKLNDAMASSSSSSSPPPPPRASTGPTTGTTTTTTSIDEYDEQKFMETLENLQNFITYKESFRQR